MIDKSHLKRKNVVGFGRSKKVKAGVRTDVDCIVFFVEKKLPVTALASEDVIPDVVGGLPTDVIETGKISALEQALSRLDRIRPAPPGASIGHFAITAGTFGAVVSDGMTGERLILSNNHVLADSNAGAIGDPILQPGPYDGGKNPDDMIGSLYRFVTIVFEGEDGGGDEPPPDEPPTCPVAKLVAGIMNALAAGLGFSHRLRAVRKADSLFRPLDRLSPEAELNTVDAAVAIPVDEIADEILEIGRPLGHAQNLSLGTPLVKSGRTSGLTSGTLDALDVTVQVEYGAGQVAVFEEQLLSGMKSQGGDSGSLVLTTGRLAAGLLFAGSDTVTVINPIARVLELLEVTIP